MLWGGGVDIASIVRCEPMELPMQTLNNLSRSLIALEPASTLIAVIEMSLSSWLVAGIVPGIERQPLKKLAVDEGALLRLLHRWREEAEKAGCRIERIVVAFEAGRDGFWLARSASQDRPSRRRAAQTCFSRAALRPTSFTPRVWRCRADEALALAARALGILVL